MKKSFMKTSIAFVSAVWMWSIGLFAHAQNNSVPNLLGTQNPYELVGRGVNAVLGLVGIIAFIIFLYGGIMWMTSEGNASKVEKGIGTMVWAAIGMVIVFASYVLAQFVLDAITGETLRAAFGFSFFI